ncbi:MAG: hypothetical protein WED05_12105 [Candidatus Atabeyarchaeum deiterrae]
MLRISRAGNRKRLAVMEVSQETINPRESLAGQIAYIHRRII